MGKTTTTSEISINLKKSKADMLDEIATQIEKMRYESYTVDSTTKENINW